jgi:cyanophycinase
LNRLNGIYFSGGNQARHLESLVAKDAAGDYTLTSAQHAILQRRHAQGQLVVAGTSAGDHIQGGGTWNGKPVPMVSGGSSYEALRFGFVKGLGANGDFAELGANEQMTSTSNVPVIYPLGGLGVFRFGVLDSHFSRRAREGRLVRATFDSAMDYGFGVDENTALVVSQPDAAGSTHFSVLGAGGVFIADVRAAHAQEEAPRAFSIDGVRAHYLLPGDTARINTAGDLQVTLSSRAPLLPAATELVTQDRLLDSGASNFLNLATAMGRAGARMGYGSTLNNADTRNQQNAPYYSATLTRDAQTVFRGGATADTKAPAPVAYTGLLLQFAPCAVECLPPTMQEHASVQ